MAPRSKQTTKLGSWLATQLAEWGSEVASASLMNVTSAGSDASIRDQQRISDPEAVDQARADDMAQTWIELAQEDADALGGDTVVAVYLHDAAGVLLCRSPAVRLTPGTKRALSFEASERGTIACLQTLVMQFAEVITRTLPAIATGQARHIEAQAAQLAANQEQQLEMIRLKERLASKEHDRTIEAERAKASADHRSRFLELAKDVLPRAVTALKDKQPGGNNSAPAPAQAANSAATPTIANFLGSLSPEQQAQIAAALGNILTDEQETMFGEVLSGG